MKGVLAGACWSLLPALVMAQSLGDVAKKERERRRDQGVSVRSFTDEDVSTFGESLRDDSPGPAVEVPAADSTAFPAAGPTTLAPSFSLEDRGGRRVSLSDFRDRVVLLDFWATWCAPCRASMPKVEKLHQRFRARGLQVIGVNMEGRSDDVLEYIDDGGYSFLFLFDGGNWRSNIGRAYGVTSIPRSYLIDRHGQIIYAGHPESLSEALVEASLE
jgi:thiol-disulfide isomerase/thioredoxin